MAISIHDSNTTTLTGGGTEDFLSSPNVEGIFYPYLDLNAMQAGDVIEVRWYGMAISGGTSRVMAVVTYTGVQPTDSKIVNPLIDAGFALGCYTNAITTANAMRLSAKQTAGTGRAIPWRIDKETGASGTVDANVVSISGDSAAADNAEAFFDGTGYAGTNNVIPTVTTVTNAVSANVTQISGDSAAADNLEAAADGTGYNLGAGQIVAASVTGATGSVTGNVGGNVVGSVGSVSGNVGGNVSGSVGSVAAGGIAAASFAAGAINAAAIAADAITDAKVAADVTIASVTGAVGSVTGNVGGNVVGSVGSVTGNVGGNVAGSVGSVTGNVGGNLVGTIGGLAAAALKDFFDTDSTTTYASAVAGSVVKEIVDNVSGGGGSCDAEEIADTILTRNWEDVALPINARSVLNALRFLRNKWEFDPDTGELTVYAEDGTTAAWTAQGVTTAGAAPVTGNSPT